MERTRRNAVVFLVSCAVAGAVGCGSGAGSRQDAASLPDADARSVDGVGDGAGGGDVPADLAGCNAQQRTCISEQQIGECQGGAWVVTAVCPEGTFCYLSNCVTRTECTPGTVQGCHSLFQQAICNPEGTAYVPNDCLEGEVCIQGMCQVSMCVPGEARCLNEEAKQLCNEFGQWADPELCLDGNSCIGGKCISACMADPKWANSSVGCEYWTVDLDQSDKATLATDHTPPAVAPHSVVLSNPGTGVAKVTFSTIAAGIVLPFGEEEIGPGETREFVMPRMDLDGAGIFDRSVRIRSNRPLVATQFNPKDVANTYSNDSSLLIPAEMLGKEYLVLGWQSQMEMAISVYPALLGYFTVVAVEPGETEIRVTLASESFGLIPNAPALAPGVEHVFKLQQYQVIQFEGVSKTMALENDMSGSHVLADKKVAVFVGNEGPLICPDEALHLCSGTDPYSGDMGCCCLEHLEEQLFPLDTWVNEYLMAKIRPRGAEDWDTYRVQAGVDNVTLSTDPPIPGLDGKVLAKKGDWIQGVTDLSFRVTGTGPIQVAQYLASMTCTMGQTGDPAQVMGVGVQQYRDNYPFLVPQGYTKDWVTIVRPVGTSITLDGEVVEVEFEGIGGTGYEFGYVEVEEGPHVMEGSAPFGLTQYGFFEATSYANPAGMNLKKQ